MVQAEKHTPLPSLPGDTHQAQSGGLVSPTFVSREPGACVAEPRPSRGRGAGPGGRVGPSRNGGELSAAAPERQCRGRRPRLRAGRAPHRRGRGHRARCPGPSPGGPPPAPPRRPPRRSRPPARLRLALRRPGTPTGDAAGSPAGASPRGGRAGGADAPGRPRAAPPSPSGRPQLTGTGRAAGHYSIAGSAPRRPRGRSRLGEGRAAGGRRGPGCRAQRPRGGGERGSGARRRKGRATMCRGEEAAAARAARTIPRGGGGRGFQEIQTLRQEIGILTKHSRPAAAPRRGLPPRLTLGPPARGRGAGGVPHTPAGLPPPCPAVEGWDLST